MGSQVPQQSPTAGTHAPSTAPEALARVVLRCREFAALLEATVPLLPSRNETPFLHGQLDDVLKRLQAALKLVVVGEPAALEKNGNFLRRLTGKKQRETPRKSEARYDLEGNAWTIPVTELVGFLSHSGKSGLLWVTSQIETFVLEFARGSLVHATSNAPPVAFRLGEILLSEKLLEPAELAHLVEHAKAADDLLGSYLVRTGRLKHSDLQRALSIQVQQLFHRLMDADNALYRFQEGGQLLRSQSLEVNITQLLLESARKKDEERQKAELRAAPAAEADAPEAATPSGLDVLEEPPVGTHPSARAEPASVLPASGAQAVAEAEGTAILAEPPAPEALSG